MVIGYNQFQNMRKFSGSVSLRLPYMDMWGKHLTLLTAARLSKLRFPRCVSNERLTSLPGLYTTFFQKVLSEIQIHDIRQSLV